VAGGVSVIRTIIDRFTSVFSSPSFSSPSNTPGELDEFLTQCEETAKEHGMTGDLARRVMSRVKEMNAVSLGQGEGSPRCRIANWLDDHESALYESFLPWGRNKLRDELGSALIRSYRNLHESLCSCDHCDFLKEDGPIQTRFIGLQRTISTGLFDTRMQIRIGDSLLDLDSSDRRPSLIDWWETGWQLHIVVPISKDESASLETFLAHSKPEYSEDRWWHHPTNLGDSVRIPLEVVRLFAEEAEYRYWFKMPRHCLNSFKAEVCPDGEASRKVLGWLYQGKEL
jgi:hypothetical protein